MFQNLETSYFIILSTSLPAFQILFSLLERKIFLNHLQYMTPSRLLESIHKHIGFDFLQRQLEELEQESFILKKEKLYLNYSSSLCNSLVLN